MNLDFPRIIQELAVNLQQPLMEPVKDACRISWDTIEMHVYHHDEDGEEMVIITLEFAEIPEAAEHAVYKLMLEANHLWSGSDYATLSVDPKKHKAMLCDKISAQLVDADSLTKRVNTLYSTAVYWQEIIEDEAVNIKPAQEYQAPVPDNDFFIKV